MLTQINIRNLAIAEQLDLELKPGMTVITGATGAGKSITLDALGLVLGDRADSGLVRHQAERADVSASFDISQLNSAQQWLAERDLDADHECILRRVISKQGRSRAYINGQAVPLQNLKQLGEQLLDIHSQHAHQALLKKDQHRHMLDAFAGISELAGKTASSFKKWHQQALQLEQLKNSSAANQAQIQLLAYQVEELDELNASQAELSALEAEQSQLAHAESSLFHCHSALSLCDDEQGSSLSGLLQQLNQQLSQIKASDKQLDEAKELFNSALIQVEEGQNSLQHFVDSFEADPQRLQEIEARLDSIYLIARKHKINAEQLADLHQDLRAELDALDVSDEKLAQLEQELVQSQQDFSQQAQKLSKQRHKAAKKLKKEVELQLVDLGMPHCQFEVALSSEAEPKRYGLENPEFLIAPNPGQPAQSLIKIASGGELSRISLAIQVITSQTSTIPVMAFDEIDVGIGGGTAEVVGRLLRQLGEHCQVLCVTHQPQVASQGHNHWCVNKQTSKANTSTQVKVLEAEEKVEEIARMLGGVEITDKTRDHAEEMLAVGK